MHARTITLFLSFLEKFAPSSSHTTREEVTHRLVEAYSQPFRHYHTDTHILDCLEKMEHVRGLISMNYRFEMALWYHDIFYIPGSTINEQASADIAINDCLILGLKRELALHVGDLIRKKPVKKFYDSLLFHDIEWLLLLPEGPQFHRLLYRVVPTQ